MSPLSAFAHKIEKSKLQKDNIHSDNFISPSFSYMKETFYDILLNVLDMPIIVHIPLLAIECTTGKDKTNRKAILTPTITIGPYTRMVSLDKLPVELLEKIASFLSDTEIAKSNLAKTNKYIYQTVLPLIYRQVKITFRKLDDT